MNIVSITDSLGESAGGLSNATFNLAISTAAHLPLDNVTILSSKDALEVDTQVVLPSNCRVVKQSCYRNPIYPLAPALYRRLIDLNPDLLHLRGLWRQASSVALKWKKHHPHKKLIVQAAGMLEPWARKRNSLLKKIRYSLVELPLFKLCDAIHATSRQEADHLIALGMDQAKIVIIEEGIFIPSIPKKIPRDGQLKTLLFLSRLHPKKGIEMLLDALSLLRPVDWQCKIVGMGDPAYVDFLKSKCSRQGLIDVVDFVGPLYGSDKLDSLMHADAFILPTYSENFGIAVAEAMSWELPVLTTTGTPWDVLQNSEMGWYVRPNLEEISCAMYELFQKTPKQLALMGKRCRAHVEQRFDWSNVGSRMADLYKML